MQTTDQTSRRGRSFPPLAWELLRPEEIKAFRREYDLTRVALALLLGVSRTSIQQWEDGRAPTRDNQAKAAALIASGSPLDRLAILLKASSTREGSSEGADDVVLVATGAIVCAFVRTQADLSAEQLILLIRAVRSALT